MIRVLLADDLALARGGLRVSLKLPKSLPSPSRARTAARTRQRIVSGPSQPSRWQPAGHASIGTSVPSLISGSPGLSSLPRM